MIEILIRRTIEHEHNGTVLESSFLRPDGPGPYPCVLLIHEYTGLNAVTLGHARRIAMSGFAVLAADFYGKDNRPANIEQARIIHRIYRDDRILMRERAQACLEVLMNQPEADPLCINALGFSFGGGAVLELARTGAYLNNAVSVYGYLDTTHKAAAGDIKCPLTAIHVENDPVVPSAHADIFKSEMAEAGAEYTLLKLENASHGFLNPEDSGYDSELAERIWEKLLKLLRSNSDQLSGEECLNN